MSYKSKFLFILTIVCVLSVSFTVALAKGEPTYIFPFRDNEYTVTSKEEIVIRYGWGACSKGLVNDYIDAVRHDFYFDDALINNIQNNDKSYWGLPFQREDPLASFCLWDVGDNLWFAYWEYKLGKLDPGDHQLFLERTLDFPVIDGADIGGDGLVDVYEGVTTSTTIIHVTP